jgi:flavin-binding protein dodecin
MTIVVVLFNLKPGVDAAEYEAWARARDLPNVNALESVRGFRVLRTQGLMNGAAAPYQYVELIELHSLDGLRADAKSDLMQGVAREFRTFADAPQFIVTQDL